MTALQIKDLAQFSHELFRGTMFDNFLLQEAVISQAVSMTLDGTLKADFYSEEELAEKGLQDCPYIPYARVRPICFEMIKGRHKPDYFKFVFLLSPKNQASTILKSGSSFKPEDISGMFLNLIYKNEMLTCTTGISYKIFSPDKSLEHEWDRLAVLFFRQHGITVEIL